jgi:hypothetical protein
MPRDIWGDTEALATVTKPRAMAVVPGVRLIPRPCSCTWRPHLSTVPATWTLTETDPYCPMHGFSSDEKSGGVA